MHGRVSSQGLSALRNFDSAKSAQGSIARITALQRWPLPLKTEIWSSLVGLVRATALNRYPIVAVCGSSEALFVGELVGSVEAPIPEDRAVVWLIKVTAHIKNSSTTNGRAGVITWDRTAIILTRGRKEFRLDNEDAESGYEPGRSMLSANARLKFIAPKLSNVLLGGRKRAH
jgi:hypothetical protein